MDPAPSHGYDTQSGAQQVLRFVGKLYLGWYALSALAAVVFLAFYLLTGFDVTDFSSHVEPTREASLASGAVFGRLGVQYRFWRSPHCTAPIIPGSQSAFASLRSSLLF